MRKFSFLVLMALLCLVSKQANAASVIQVAAPASINTAATAALDGDTIELTTSGGAYTLSTTISITTEKSLTFRAAAGLTIRPVVTYLSTSYFFRYYPTTGSTIKTLTFDGIEFNGNNTALNFLYVRCPSLTSNLNVIMNNCIVRNLSTTSGRVFSYVGTSGITPTVYGNLTVTNSEFKSTPQGILSASLLYSSPNNTSFSNCLFVGPTITTGGFIRVSATGYNSFNMDHCTFTNSNYSELFVGASVSTSIIKNTLFTNSTNTGSYYNSFGNTKPIILGADCGVYYTGAGNKSLIYPNSTSALATNPVLNATTGIATDAAYMSGSTDGYQIGYYGNKIISTSAASITDLDITSSILNPSAEKSFTVSAIGLTANLVVTPPTNYEISETSGASFVSTSITLTQIAGSVASTTIYVRLKAGLTDNTYTGNINLTSTGITAKTVSLTGTVLNSPTIYSTSLSLSDFKYAIGGGPSSEQSITVNAINLTSNLSISAPSNYEISPLSGASFTPISPISIAQSGGVVSPTTIYVRLKAGLSINSYSQNVSLTATNAVTKNVALSGSVTNLPVISNSVSDITGLYSFNNIGQATEQSFTVSGTDLTTELFITPPEYFQVSTTPGSGFTSLPLSIPLVNSAVATTTIYVRIDPNQYYMGALSGDLTIETTGATSKTITISGTGSYQPSITISKTSATGFNYYTGSGPSAEQTFNVSGSFLTDNVVITAPTNFEISTASGVSFVANASISLTPTNSNLSSTAIYIRLKSGLTANTYTGNINLTATYATSKSVALSGTITNPPTITASVTTLSGMDYNLAFGPSLEKSFTVSGAYLSSIILITAPTNFEISTSTGASFSAQNQILISQSGGTAAQTTIYVRLKAGLIANNYTGDITLASTGVITQNIACSGTITNRTSITTSTATLTGMRYDLGFGPSSEQLFTVSGNYLSTNLIINAPTNFEISTSTGVLFSGQNQLSIPVVGGVAALTTIYVRIKVGLAANDYSGNITLTSSDATTQNVACSGTIFDPVNLTIQVGSNGTVTENSATVTDGTVIVVYRGNSKTFSFIPSLGYEVATLTYNGTDVKSAIINNQYTATVNGTSTLSVTYKKMQFVLSLKDASSGSIDLISDYGTINTFRFTPATDWRVSTVFYNDNDVTSSVVDGTYTVPAITANGLLNVSFVNFNVGAPQLVNGKIKVYTHQSNIIVEGTSIGEDISLFTVNGVQMQLIQSQGDRMVIPVQKDAVYLVKTSNMTFKVIL